VRVVLDNSKAGDAEFASSLHEALTAAGFEVEVREPAPRAFHDTSVHFVVEGVSVRVPEDIAPSELATVAAAVRKAESHRGSERRRVRDVAIYRGETSRVLVWVDVFDTSGP
jgi:hypothetical protein